MLVLAVVRLMRNSDSIATAWRKSEVWSMSPVESTAKDRGTILAEERTNLALRRTLIAADRTLMAWIRTALSMIGFGFSIYKFFQYFARRNCLG